MVLESQDLGGESTVIGVVAGIFGGSGRITLGDTLDLGEFLVESLS